MMIHSVYFWLNDSMTEDQRAEFEAGLKALFQIGCVASGRYGKPAGTPARGVTENTFHYALFLEFNTVADHNTYQSHPDHDVFVNSFSRWFKTVKVFDTEFGA